MPTISIILPTYNREHLLGRSIQSVLNQTYRDFELIIVDDGSTDNTEKLVRSFKKETINYIKHRENRGPATARNTGIKSASGEYIAFQDSDDEWLPEKLEKQMMVFKASPPDVGVVYTGFFQFINTRKRYIPPTKVVQKDGYIFANLMKDCFVSTQTTLVKRDCFIVTGMFDERFTPSEDWELFLRMSRQYQFRCVNEPLVIVYHQPDSITANLSAEIRSYKLVLDQYFEDISHDSRVMASHYFRIGRLLYSSGECSQGRDYFVKSVRAYPLDIRAYGTFLISLLGKTVYTIAENGYEKISAWLLTRRNSKP